MYTICVGKRETFMFLEEDQSVDRWFMERKWEGNKNLKNILKFL
jgi:hypothetical protein